MIVIFFGIQNFDELLSIFFMTHNFLVKNSSIVKIYRLLNIRSCWSTVDFQELTSNSKSSTSALSRFGVSTLDGPGSSIPRPSISDSQLRTFKRRLSIIRLQKSDMTTVDHRQLTINIRTIDILNINSNVVKKMLSTFLKFLMLCIQLFAEHNPTVDGTNLSIPSH